MASFQALLNRISQLSRDMGDALQLRGFKAGGTTGQVPIKNSSTAFDWSWGTPAGGGSGTVTSVSVVTANGVSASVASATTTPAITITLGAITPTSVAASGNVTGSNLSGTNTGDETLSTIKTKLGITVLSGDNTGDQDLSGYLTSSTAASTYQTLSGMSSYLTASSAASTYAPLTGTASGLTVGGLTNATISGTVAFSGGADAAFRTALGLGTANTPSFTGTTTTGQNRLDNGSKTTPSLAQNTNPDTGFYFRGSGVNSSIDASIDGTVAFALNSNGFQIRSVGLFAISPGDPAAAAPDVGLSRISAGLFGIGTGAAGSFAGSMKLTNLEAVGAMILGSFTVGTVPSVSTFTRGLIWVSNESGGACAAYSNGTNWKRIYDNANIS